MGQRNSDAWTCIWDRKRSDRQEPVVWANVRDHRPGQGLLADGFRPGRNKRAFERFRRRSIGHPMARRRTRWRFCHARQGGSDRRYGDSGIQNRNGGCRQRRKLHRAFRLEPLRLVRLVRNWRYVAHHIRLRKRPRYFALRNEIDWYSVKGDRRPAIPDSPSGHRDAPTLAKGIEPAGALHTRNGGRWPFSSILSAVSSRVARRWLAQRRQVTVMGRTAGSPSGKRCSIHADEAITTGSAGFGGPSGILRAVHPALLSPRRSSCRGAKVRSCRRGRGDRDHPAAKARGCGQGRATRPRGPRGRGFRARRDRSAPSRRRSR
jgi:hypothetical protein